LFNIDKQHTRQQAVFFVLLRIIMKITGAQAIIASLLEEKVDVLFGYPGGAIMPVYDALYDARGKIRHILVRHEQAAAHAAEGYARVTGKPGIALATSGPGATNLVTGIADAMMDSVPIICITGQVSMEVLGTDAFQEVDVIGITTPITKWNYQITKASEIPQTFAKAFAIAGSGRPGPVVIDVTKNAQMEMMEFSYTRNIYIAGYQPTTEPNSKQIQLAAKMINDAKNPYMLIGHGILIANAQEEVSLLAEKTGMPVASTLHGLSAMYANHPLYVGMLGMHGNYGPNVLTNKADVILAVGMRFDDRVTGKIASYAPNAKIIHIDIDPAELNKNVRAIVPIVADAKEALKKLLLLVKEKKHDAWVSSFHAFARKEYKKVISREIHPRRTALTMAEVVHMLSKKTKGKAVIVADVGQHQMITARYYKFLRPHSFITSGGLGTMGFALPAAMGAKLANAKREVIAIIGDGSFQMNIQELATIAQEKLPIKVIILNNNFLGMVRQWQELFYDNRYSFVSLKNPDFIAVAKGFGLKGEKVDERKKLAKAIDTLLSRSEPYILNIIVEKEDNVFPMMPSGKGVEDIRLE
jgi:acetolactate synthase-1/2/3 large subunit